MTEFNAQTQDKQAFESLTDQNLESVSAGLLLPPPFAPELPIFPIFPWALGSVEN